jgi:hypothetical protein
MVAKVYTIRLHEKGQALMDALVNATGYSQSEVAAEALERYAHHVYNVLVEQATDGSTGPEDVQQIAEKTRPLKQALGMFGK